MELGTIWGTTADGFPAHLYSLENEYVRVRLTDIGAALVSLETRDRTGAFGNIVVSGADANAYFNNPCYLGVTVGRYANRIAKGRFWLEGVEYVLPVNNGPNHLHGGVRGISNYIWSAEGNASAITFRWWSLAGQEGYPGNLHIAVTYRLEGNNLSIEYSARTDAPTVVNLTNHAYWNLAGRGSILAHNLKLHADQYLENDKDVLPTGNILNVAGTPFDFRQSHAVGDQLQAAGGYDNCYVVRNWDSTLRPAAQLSDPVSGRTMDVYTTEPGIQLYTANYFDGSVNSAGYQQHEALCLECQRFPDSPNQLEFPSTTLRAGEEYRQTTQHRFGVL